MQSSLGPVLGMLGLISLPAQSQSLQIGLQAGFIQPQSDVLRSAVNDKSGFNAGLHLAIHLGNGKLLRPRLDYLHFPTRTDQFSGGITSDYKLSGLSLGVDYLHHFRGTNQGFYLLGGVSMNQWKVKAEDISVTIIPPNPPVVTRSPSNATSNKAALTAGLGYQFTPSFGFEARYQMGRIFESDANFIQAGFTCRF